MEGAVFDFEISEKQMNELETFFATTPNKLEKVLKTAVRKAGARARKIQRDYANNRYVNSKNTLNNNSHKVKTIGNESIIMASSKPGKIDNFYVSLTKPSSSSTKLKAQVLKSSGKKTMSTMFWAFYKKDKSRTGLWIRNGKERHKISPVRTVSPFQMATKADQLLMEDEIQGVFSKALDEAIYKELG